MNRQDFTTIFLPDGRKLAYAEYGDPEGVPVFFFHGFPGSRYDGEYSGQIAAEMGIRLIAPDRPGMGHSDFQPNRRLLDWPADVCNLADTLKLDMFGVLGYSGGGPHALACAVRIPERLKTTGVIAGVSPVTEPGALDGMLRNNVQIFTLSRQVPWLLNLIYRWNNTANGEKLMRAGMAQMAKPDQTVMQNPEVLRGMAKDYKEAFRQSPRGVVHEGGLFASDWGFKLSEIQAMVYLWQGKEDTNVPLAMGRYQASHLPNCIAKYFAGEGHISIITHCIREILAVYV
ncbi:MAG: alpha/beta hydrolase [Anaerolineae bacterium]|nr:alpha/beta hydrolase [Anaerolineae bacterium]